MLNITKYESIYIVNNIKRITNKLALFDLDNTIIKYNRSNKSDITLFNQYVINTLLMLQYNDFSIIIITNQLNLKSINDFTKKIECILHKLSILTIPFFISINDDQYRKPRIGILEMICKKILNVNISELDKLSFYCGDAIGRENDFSDTDFKFALNAGLNFISPEDMFIDNFINIDNLDYFKIYKKEFSYPNIINPIYNLQYNKIINEIKQINITENKLIIILTGSPASGKSYFSNKLVNDLNQICQIDRRIIITMDNKTNKQYKEAILESINTFNVIILDSTNRTKKGRTDLINYINKKINNINYISIDMTIEKKLALHLNAFRNIYQIKIHTFKNIPDIAIHAYYKKYEKPELSEGFNSLFEIQFSNENVHSKYMKMYLK